MQPGGPVKTNRRTFLQLLGIGALAGVLPVPEFFGARLSEDRPLSAASASSWGNFNPHCEYGREVSPARLGSEALLGYLHRDANLVLPPGTPYELRLELPDRFGRHTSAACWYFSPHFLFKVIVKKRGHTDGSDFGRPRHRFEVEEMWEPYGLGESYQRDYPLSPDSWGQIIPEMGCYCRGPYRA